MVDYVIPGNDDAIRAVKLITGVMANAIVEANGGELVDYVSTDDRAKDDAEIMQKAVDSVKKKEPRRFEGNKNFDRKQSVKKSSDKVETKKEAKKEVKTTEKKAVVDLSTKTVAELREMAKDKEIKGYSTMKKAELVEALQ